MRQRDLRLEKYEIGKYAFRELKNLCLQYPELKHRALSSLEIQAIHLTGMPHGSGVGNPTEAKGMVLAVCNEECRLIEDTAKEAAGGVWGALMKNVTAGIRYEDTGAPCGKQQFYDRRRYFFYLLAKKKGKI